MKSERSYVWAITYYISDFCKCSVVVIILKTLWSFQFESFAKRVGCDFTERAGNFSNFTEQ